MGRWSVFACTAASALWPTLPPTDVAFATPPELRPTPVLVDTCLADCLQVRVVPNVASAPRGGRRYLIRSRCSTAGTGAGRYTLNTHLIELVEAYFLSADTSDRASLITDIEKISGGSIEVVIEALGRAELWRPLPDKEGYFSVVLPGSGAIDVAYRLPTPYDPAKRHPMLLSMPGGGVRPQTAFDAVRRVFRGGVGSFVLVCPGSPVSGSFDASQASAGDLNVLLRETRRRIHIDSDRTYLIGRGTGGDAAWLAAITHPDLFAGVIVLSGYPRLPYAQQLYPIVLENLRSTPVLSVWTGVDDGLTTLREGAVAMHNRAALSVARGAGLPVIGMQSADRHLMIPQADVRKVLTRDRPPPSCNVSYWFRYPAQGRAWWLRQTKFNGEIWDAEQLSILPSPGVDRNQFITDVLKSKLAYIGGRIEGQTVIVRTHRCAGIELLFTEDLVDLDRPVTVLCNGRKRHQGMIRRSIRTLLTNASENWDFQRLVIARLSFSISSDHGPP